MCVCVCVCAGGVGESRTPGDPNLEANNWKRFGSHSFFTCRDLVHGRCHVWPWLIQFSGVKMSCFTLSRSTTFTEISPIQQEDSPIPLFEAILY